MTNRPSSRVHSILIIDADFAVGATLEPYFKPQGFEVIVTNTAADGLTEAAARLPIIIILGSMLPDNDSLAVFKQLRSKPRTANIPVMFLADPRHAKQQNEYLSAGVDDFITKPFDVDILGLRVRNAIKRQEREGITHPRSGLPTGRLIQEHVRALADELDWYKIDFGINAFDAFREQYGFMSGEEVITFTVNLINEVVKQAGLDTDFVGHRDDTDFVIITHLAKGPALKATLEKRFNEEVLSFYTFMEREEGSMDVPDGNGGVTKKPLMAAKIKVQEGEAAD